MITALKYLFNVVVREFRIIFMHKIYLMCMVFMPCLCAAFFTTLMVDGVPTDLPVGVVDQDNTTMTRKVTRMLDSFQSSKVVAHYPSLDDARSAMQRGEIYGFIHFPENMTSDLLSQRQPEISFYYSSITMSAGSLVFKDLKTVATLAKAGVVSATLTAKGVNPQLTKAVLQPIAVDAHNIGNPYTNYNVYLCTPFVPACFLLFVLLMTPFCFGTELKFGTSKEFMSTAGDDPVVAMIGKILPHTLIYFIVMFGIMTYLYGYLDFPAPGGYLRLALLGFLAIIGTQGLGLCIFGLCPSLRMGMSFCSLMGVLSFSMVGSAFPVFAMDAPLQAAAWMFPMRHYYMIYELCVFNTFPLSVALPHILCLILFFLLSLFFAGRIATAMRRGVYME